MSWKGRKVERARVAVAQAYGMNCWLCGEPIVSWREYEVDHVVPRALGGTDSIENLRPAHGVFSRQKCNLRKGASVAPPPRLVDNSGWFA